MIVTFITRERMFTLSLPRRPSGRYWVEDVDSEGRPRRIADVEGVQRKWLLHGSPVLALLDEQRKQTDIRVLEDGIQVVGACYRDTQEKVQLLIEPSTDDRQVFRKYVVSGPCRLDIGRTGDNDITFDNQYVSAHHACLVWQDGAWSATDTQSSNGTFVNERRIATTPLAFGDTVYVMGLKIVVGNGFFAMNDPDGGVRLNTDKAAPLARQECAPLAPDVRSYEGRERFSRSPRIYQEIVPAGLKVDPPPPPVKKEETPLALMLGPALTMGMTALVMGLVALNNLAAGTSTLITALPTLVMSAAMLCGTLLWPQLTRRHEKKETARAEAERQAKYREYLDRVRDRIYSIGAEQKKILEANCPGVDECERELLSRGRRLWERTGSQGDFLRLRLGTGDLPLEADIRFPEEKFSIEADALSNEVLRLAGEPKVIPGAPVSFSLLDNPVIGVAGEPLEAEAFVQNLVLQLAALHSYDEVKLVVIADRNRPLSWESVRLFPHVWEERGEIRCYATGESEVKGLSACLERLIAQRLEAQGQKKRQVPHYVVVAPSLDLAEKAGFFAQALSNPEEAGFSCITVARRIDALPKECSLVVELKGDTSVVYDRSHPDRARVTFRAEGTGKKDLDRAADVLGNLALETLGEEYTLPSMMTFLEMFGVGKVEHLNALTRWKENSPVNSLQTPLGVGEDGEPFYLDLHEKAHGPHGLVAGMTGSGKSEFIITMILSMAVNYHPDEVAFILIDYKGGGLAGAFEDPEAGIRLPHLAGTITNLDGAAVNRALISIQSELRRRQAVFNKARQISGEGTIDIYKYQKMYRSGLVDQPVPHLFIISDEFAELKAQQPDFMTQLVSAARIGRSLGVHLILATQKPSGVVDDQIWSNSRFRICLKVQERADSVEMLKRPDAAELKETGRFYLQVGFNELFRMGQSAWCGAPYVPADRLEKKSNDCVAVIDTLGRVMVEAQPKTASRESKTSQVVAIVDYLSDLAAGEHVSARNLWLPPIPEKIYWEDLKNKYSWSAGALSLDPIVGEFDDPFNQSQGLLTLPLTQEGNALLYGMAGSGKTTLLNTLLYGLCREYSPEQLNLYIIDLGEETLRAFEKAPQVGEVLLSSDGEKIVNLFKMLTGELARRRKLFSQADGDFTAYCTQSGETVPHILVILRNYAAFNEQFEALDAALLQLTRDCAKYGIYFLVTANSANSVRYRVAQNFSTVLCLQLNDRSDYIGLFGGTDGIYPSKLKGRGIFKKQRTYEFQAAHFARESGLAEVRAFAREQAGLHSARARRVPVLPGRITADTFETVSGWGAVPVGIEKASLQPACIDLEHSVISLLLTQNPQEMADTAQGISELLARLDGTVGVLDGAGLLEESGELSFHYIKGSFAGLVDSLFAEMVRRNNTYKTAAKENREPPVFQPEYYVFTGLQTILDGLSAEGKDRLQTLMEKAEPEYGIRFLLCGTAKEMNAFTLSPWYKRHLSGSDGIWVGDGISGQYVMKVNKVTNDLYSEIPPHFGYLVRRGKPVLMKLIVGRKTAEEEDE